MPFGFLGWRISGFGKKKGFLPSEGNLNMLKPTVLQPERLADGLHGPLCGAVAALASDNLAGKIAISRANPTWRFMGTG